MSVRLITVTPNAEKTIAYVARVSSPNQDNTEIAGLLNYCVRHGHWGIFEHAYMTVEIETTRMISAQILRHRSFTFSEFSQRYSEPMDFTSVDARMQAAKNRQSSVDNAPTHLKVWWKTVQDDIWRDAQRAYDDALAYGIAKECARAILPMNTTTRLYMTGSARSWIHYIQLRTQPDTQLEHREIAEQIKAIFIDQFPTVAEALWEST